MMRHTLSRTASVFTVTGAIACAALLHAQGPAVGRIAGRVVDTTGAVLTGVEVTLTADSVAPHSVVTNIDGQFSFDGLDPEKSYAVRAALPGHDSALRDVRPASVGETTTVDLVIDIRCATDTIIDIGQYSPFDQMLMADAIVYLRVVAEGVTRRTQRMDYCDFNTETDATVRILGAAHALPAEWGSKPIITLSSDSVDVTSGTEYLAFLVRRKAPQRTFIGTAWPVINGRVQSDDEPEIGLRGGMPIATALKHLRETYTRFIRYRTYDDLTKTPGLETLSHRTGWVDLGELERDRDVWREEPEDVGNNHRPFAFVEAPQSSRALPHRHESIRLKRNEPVVILDFGARGEALRNRSPTTRASRTTLSDLTGTHADPAHVYTVMDVQLQRLDDARIVWVRLVATP